jgi:hypothetical protein
MRRYARQFSDILKPISKRLFVVTDLAGSPNSGENVWRTEEGRAFFASRYMAEPCNESPNESPRLTRLRVSIDIMFIM